MRAFSLFVAVCMQVAALGQSVYFTNFSQGASQWLRPVGASGARWEIRNDIGYTDNVSLFMANNQGGVGTVSAVSPEFALTAGVRYAFGWARRALSVPNGENINIRLVRNNPQGGSVVVTDLLVSGTFVNTNWMQESVSFTAPVTSSQYTLQFSTQASAFRSGPVIDDITVARICGSTPAAGTAIASAPSVCVNGSVTLSLSGATDSLGLNFQWQQRTSVGGQWQNINGATQPVYTAVSLAQNVEFRCVVSCAGVGSAVSSAPVTVSVGTPVNDQRCNATTITPSGQWIEGDNRCATISGLGESWGTNNMWYKFTAPASRNYRLVIKTPAGTDKINHARIRIYSSVSGDCNTINNASLVGTEINFPFSNAAYDSVGVESTANFTAGVTYFIAVASDNSANAGRFRLKLSELPLLPCPQLVAPAPNATNVARDAAFQWNAVAGAQRYQVISSSGTSPVTFGVVATTQATAVHQMRGFSRQPEWTVRAENADFSSVNCATRSFTTENNSANNRNFCYYADTLSVTRSAIATNNMILSESIVPINCNPRKTPPSVARDVWFAIKPAEAGSIQISSMAAIASTHVDPVIQLFTGSCDQPIPIVCTDQNSANGYETITYNVTDVNQPLWVRVYNAGNAPDNFETRIAVPDTCSLLVTHFAAPIGGATQYQWQVNTGNGFQNINDDAVYRNTRTSILTIRNPPTSFRGYQYRCLANTASGQQISATQTLGMSAVWLGTANSSWSNPANWQCGRLPDRFTDVVIGTGTTAVPQVDVSQEVQSLRLSQGATLQVQPGVNLTILKGQ